MNQNLNLFIQNIPKAELHLHIEGTLEPELIFVIAKRNNLRLPYTSVEELKKKYLFHNLQEFLNIYYQGTVVLQKEQDFYDLTLAYLEKASSQGVKHAEIFFDPQSHTERGISFKSVIDGISNALAEGVSRFGISSKLILCFLRHLDEAAALKTLKEALPFKEKIIAVGLDSSEVGHPPSKFKNVFNQARKEGFLTVSHAGEEGPVSYIHEALDLLHVNRIDHGNHVLDDESLVEKMAKEKIPLTLCPLSNLKLKVVEDLHKHPLKKMMEKSLLVSLNSDDPAYFGGYIADNYRAITEALDLSQEEIVQLAKNSFQSSFLSSEEKKKMIGMVEAYKEH